MAKQLIATFYVQSPEAPFVTGMSVTVLVQKPNSSGGWTTDSVSAGILESLSTNNFVTEVTTAHYADPEGSGQTYQRWKVDVYRRESSGILYPNIADVYERRLEVSFREGTTTTSPVIATLTRVLYLTVQPDVTISHGGVDLVSTSTTGTPNPANLQKNLVVNPAPEAITAREIRLNGSNDYKGNIFVKANFPINAYCEDLTPETSAGLLATTWLFLRSKIHVTRYGGSDQSGERKWPNTTDILGNPNNPTIKTDGLEHYIEFVTTSFVNYPVELRFEKLLLVLPLFLDPVLRLDGQSVQRYTGSGTATANTPTFSCPLSIVLKTPHAVKITPKVITLNEDNNYTSFVAVEANDNQYWSFTNVDPGITVNPSSGTGRTAVVVQKAALFDWDNEDFHNIALTATSTVDPLTYPNVDGLYTVTDTSHVHIERYAPTRNALIPKMDSSTVSGVTMRHINNDTAQELLTSNAAFAMTSVGEEIFIDTDTPTTLTQITLAKVNTRRCTATSTYKGGAAAAFSLYGTNDKNGAWTLLRDGSAVTDIAANTNTPAVGSWNIITSTNTNLVPTNPAPYRYYKIVPINRSGGSTELSCVLTALTLSPSVPCTVTSSAPSLSADMWKSFDNSLSIHGFAGRFTTGLYSSGSTLATATGNLNPSALQNLDNYPTVEVEFNTSHRVRSWSLQSVGTSTNDKAFESHATVLVLQGRTLDGEWKVLDLARTSTASNNALNLYDTNKNRIDRAVQHVELVNAVRISVVAVNVLNTLYPRQTGGYVWFPQIQIFAGVPMIPKMTSNSQNNVTIATHGSGNGMLIFDRIVNGASVAAVVSEGWYIHNHYFLQDDVAENGNPGTYNESGSKGWLRLTFPLSRLLGYLYSIDNLLGRSDNPANTPYAASLLFEGRETALDNWVSLGLVSLDHCLGHHNFGVSTAVLIADPNQTDIHTYVQGLQSLGLSVVDHSFLMNRHDLHIIRYDARIDKWYDDGMRFQPDAFSNQATGTLLNTGQAQITTVASTRLSGLQPPLLSLPDKATIVNTTDTKRMIYDLTTGTWDEVPNNDAIYRVHDRTYYTDLIDSGNNPLTLSQLRFAVQSIMNTEKQSTGLVAMPEMQFFGLPTDTINGDVNNVAAVAYLKAEDANGNLHDILGKHQRLPYQRYDSSGSRTYFRFYIGGAQHLTASPRLYLTLQNTSGTMTTLTSGTPADSASSNHKAITNNALDLSESGNFTSPTYYELYIYSSSNEKIILSSGYTGGQS